MERHLPPAWLWGSSGTAASCIFPYGFLPEWESLNKPRSWHHFFLLSKFCADCSERLILTPSSGHLTCSPVLPSSNGENKWRHQCCTALYWAGSVDKSGKVAEQNWDGFEDCLFTLPGTSLPLISLLRCFSPPTDPAHLLLILLRSVKSCQNRSRDFLSRCLHHTR